MSRCDLPRRCLLSERTKTLNYYTYRRHPCDVVIMAEGTQFPTHRRVLRELSPYFSAMFSRWNSHMYTIPGVTPKVMKPILQYAYSKQIRIRQSNVQDLLVAADYLLVGDIVKRCTQFLENHLCPQNCLEMLEIADKLSLRQLSDQAQLMFTQAQPNIIAPPTLRRSHRRR